MYVYNYSERGTPYVVSFWFDGIYVTLHCFAILAGRILNLISFLVGGNFPYKKVFWEITDYDDMQGSTGIHMSENHVDERCPASLQFSKGEVWIHYV